MSRDCACPWKENREEEYYNLKWQTHSQPVTVLHSNAAKLLSFIWMPVSVTFNTAAFFLSHLFYSNKRLCLTDAHGTQREVASLQMPCNTSDLIHASFSQIWDGQSHSQAENETQVMKWVLKYSKCFYGLSYVVSLYLYFPLEGKNITANKQCTAF